MNTFLLVLASLALSISLLMGTIMVVPTLIIYYRSALADEIKTSLLNLGYFSTTTQTDFKELPPQIYNPKTITIVYTSTGEGGIDGILKVLKDKGYTEQKKNLIQARAEDLRSGNIQIYIF